MNRERTIYRDGVKVTDLTAGVRRERIGCLQKRANTLRARIAKNPHFTYDKHEHAALNWAIFELKRLYPERLSASVFDRQPCPTCGLHICAGCPATPPSMA